MSIGACRLSWDIYRLHITICNEAKATQLIVKLKTIDMKKIILGIIMLCASVSTFAQHSVGSWNIQPKIGLNIANLTDSHLDSRVGLVLGAELEYQVNPKVSLSFGGLYSQQGGDDFNVDYFNIPVLAHLYVARGLALKAGLQPGFKVNGEGAKSTDVSIPLGISYEFRQINLEARYNWGLTNVAGDSNNSVFQVTIGYKIPL